MRRDIHLTGSEITVLKALGVSGTPMAGHILLARLGEVDEHELFDTLQGLMDLDYIVSSKVNIMKMQDVERSIFRVNSVYAEQLRDAMRPGRREDEDRGRRQRRR